MKTLIDILPADTLAQFAKPIQNAMQTVPVMYNGFYDIQTLCQKLKLPLYSTNRYRFRDRWMNAWIIAQYNFFIQHQIYFAENPQTLQNFKELYFLKRDSVPYKQYNEQQKHFDNNLRRLPNKLLLSKSMLKLACQQDYFLNHNLQLMKTTYDRYHEIIGIDNLKQQNRIFKQYYVTDACDVFQRETTILCVTPKMIFHLLRDIDPFDKINFCKSTFAYKVDEHYW